MKETSIFFVAVGLRSSEKVVRGGLSEGTSRPTSRIVHANAVHASFSPSALLVVYCEIRSGSSVEQIRQNRRGIETVKALRFYSKTPGETAACVESQSQERRYCLVGTCGKVKASGLFHGHDTCFLFTLTKQLIGIHSKCALSSSNLTFERHTKDQPAV